jgi:hypothetical protein
VTWTDVRQHQGAPDQGGQAQIDVPVVVDRHAQEHAGRQHGLFGSTETSYLAFNKGASSPSGRARAPRVSWPSTARRSSAVLFGNGK